MMRGNMMLDEGENKKIERTEKENSRTTGAIVGGAIFGASIAGPAGAVLGGLVGVIVGEVLNQKEREEKKNG